MLPNWPENSTLGTILGKFSGPAGPELPYWKSGAQNGSRLLTGRQFFGLMDYVPGENGFFQVFQVVERGERGGKRERFTRLQWIFLPKI
jgi:hypothetical protein